MAGRRDVRDYVESGTRELYEMTKKKFSEVGLDRHIHLSKLVELYILEIQLITLQLNYISKEKKFFKCFKDSKA